MSFPPAESLPRVVLDSNVWIDILVFDDPATRPIAAALADRRIEAVIDRRCLGELNRVLDYPQFERFAIDKSAALAQVEQWTTSVPLPDPPPAESALAESAPAGSAPADPPPADPPPAERPAVDTAPVLKLPQCKDRDDQKFLELAYRANAAWLVSKDRELLRMAKRIARDFGFSIGLPKAFTTAFDTGRPVSAPRN